MEDIYFKMKYTKCKLKVKKWESEFKKEHGTNPSKNDIKSAPPFIKEAYKIYYNLKTMALENSLLGSILGDEDTMDSFSASINNSDISNSMNNLNSNTEKLNIKINNKISCVEEYPNSESNILPVPYDSSNIKANIQQECKELSFEIDSNNHNKDTVWGPHLRKKPKEKKQSIIPSSSLSYTAKLFPGAKFNKRNPRKSHTFTKTKKLNESINESTSVFHSENSLSSYDPKGFILQPLPDNNTDLVGCNIVDNKIKITKATIPVVSQPVSLIHKTLNNPNNEILTLRKLDTGWVERTAQSNLLEISQISNISDSGINLKDSNVLSNNLNDVKLVMNSGCSTIEASDDEDFIYDSDSEMESKHKLNISRVSLKRSFDSLNNIFDDSQSKRYKSESKNINCIKSPTKLVNKSYLNNSVFETKDVKNTSTTLVTNCSNIPNSSNKPFNTKDLKIISTTLVDGEYSSSVNEGSETTEKVKHKISGVTLVDKCSSILENSEPEVEVKKKTARSKLSLQERLELKMASGKANENFVKVNIQKKVFVRGKKTMTFSKFKKKQWKANQKSLHGGKGGGGRGGHAGILKCFKCGDVGHFSRACMKAGDQLLPKAEDGDEEDESPFPTLEEAEEMAKECAERLHIKKKDVEDQINTDEVNSVEEDETALLLQPEPIEEQSFQSGIEPIFQVNEDGTLIETPLIVLDALMKFGHEKFRPGQEKVIMRILSGLSTLVTLATGTGKSLCYQLPAYIYHKYRKCITLVVSPLVSLMEDQVAKSSPCLNIACLHANQTPKKREQVLELLKNNELTVLLVSPEAVVQGERIGMNNFLRDLPPVAFACVDEAHCVSQWSHNFRPSYLSIFQVLREKMGVKTILGLTATATINTMSSIATHIGVPDGVQGIFRDTPLPNNLILSVSKEKRKDLALITLLKGPRFSSCESIIVYCTRREECERISAFLRTCLQDVSKEDGIDKRGKISWNAEAYHAGLRPGRRLLIQNAFMAGKLRIVIATVAFGMGINKKDIRGIVHYNMPSTFESYVQEVGRAGRDGLPAHCHLFLDSEGRDLNELRRHIYSNSTERHTIRKLLQRVFVPCRCKNTCPRHEVAFSIQATVEALDLRQENIATLLCYLELHKQNWAKVLSPVYTLCRIHSYKGAKYLKKAAKECAPLAMAIAMELKRSTKLDNMKMLQFSVYDVAAAINWDSGIVKYHLKNLEWTKVNNQPKRSGLVVELTELGFRLRAPGNLSSDELDSALDSLYNRVKMQETTSLKKLQAIFQALVEASYKSVEDCLDRVETERCETLKLRIRDYFSKEGELDKISLPEPTLDNEEQIVADIRNLIFSYRDCTFTGRAIARIFHGIESPNFPALVWYSCRYWREHLNQNFNALCKVATRELLRMR